MTLHLRKMKEQNKKFFNDKHQLRRIFLNVNDLMLWHDIKLDNKYDLKLIFQWNESFKMRKTDSIKKTYVLKKMNETRLNETYTENRLKHFKTRKMRIENVEEEKIDLTKFLKDVEKLEKIIETVKKTLKRISRWKKKILIKLRSWKKIDERRKTV